MQAGELLIAHGLAGAALDVAAIQSFDIPFRVRRSLLRAALSEAQRTLLATTVGVRVVDRLAKLNTPAMVVKGAGIDWRLGEHLRPANDLDVLVAPEDYASCRALLRSDHIDEPHPNRSRSYFDRYCYEGTGLLHPSGTSIDLHHHVSPWWWGRRMTVARLLPAATIRRVDGIDVPLASPMHNLLVVALHVIADRSLPGATLKTWVDLGQLTQQCDPAAVAAEARSLGVAPLLRLVLGQAPAGPGVRSVLDAIGAAPLGCDERFRLRFLLPPAFGSRHHFGHALRLPVANGVLFLAGEMVPDRQRRDEKLGRPTTLVQWWLHSVRKAYEASRATSHTE